MAEMSPWTKENALEELDALIGEVDTLRGSRSYSAAHTRWIARTLAFLEEVFGRNSRYYLSLAALKWRAESFLIDGGELLMYATAQEAINERHRGAYLQQLETARGLLQAASDHLRRSHLDSVYQGKNTGPEASSIIRILNLANRKLRKVVRGKPTAEKQVQDAFENLLIAQDLPYSREADSIEYSSKTYVPDFTLAKLDLAVELKLCAQPRREKEVIAEINDDILAYRTRYANVLFIIYDLGMIRDVERFTGAFEQHTNVLVTVVKH